MFSEVRLAEFTMAFHTLQCFSATCLPVTWPTCLPVTWPTWSPVTWSACSPVTWPTPSPVTWQHVHQWLLRQHVHQWLDQHVYQCLGQHVHQWLDQHVHQCLGQHVHQWLGQYVHQWLGKMFTSELEKCKKMICPTCSLVKLTGEYVGLVPGIRHLIR